MEQPDNYFGQLFIELSDFIKAQVPEIKWIDQDFGQLEHFEYRPDVDFPCLLIDFAATSYSDMSEGSQIGEVTVMLRLAFNPFSQSYQAAPTDVRQKAVAYYALEQKVFNNVQGWYNDFTTPFDRIGSDTEQRHQDGLRVRIQTFTTSYEDYSAMPMSSKSAANMVIDTEQF